MTGLTLDNTEGDEPNDLSDGDPAAHNSDGFDISGSDTVTLSNIKVRGQIVQLHMRESGYTDRRTGLQPR